MVVFFVCVWKLLQKTCTLFKKTFLRSEFFILDSVILFFEHDSGSKHVSFLELFAE